MKTFSGHHCNVEVVDNALTFVNIHVEFVHEDLSVLVV